MKKIIIKILVLLMISPVYSAGLFKPKDIVVHEKADTVVIAKKQAFTKAKKQSWVNLINMLGVSDTSEISKLDEKEIDALIETIEVNGEKARAKIYSAKIKIYFNPKKVRSYLKENNFSFVEERGFPVLVVPVYEVDGITYIYEDNNLWEKALMDNPKKGGLLPVILAEGGVKNSLKIDSSVLINEEQLLHSAKSYGVEGVVIAKVSVIPTAKGSKIKLSYNSIGGFLNNQNGFVVLKSKDSNSALKKATASFYTALETMWQKKIKNNVNMGKNKKVVVMSTSNVIDLEDLKEKLFDIDGVEEVRTSGLNAGLVEFEITFMGLAKKLKIAFERLGYLVDNEHNKWVVRRPAN
ncbi:MAG: DUF2066 domain-containing protein [Alphaproteobacteria bacterium]